MKKLLIGFAAVLTIGNVSVSYSQQADHGRPPAPKNPDLAYMTWSPAYDHGRPPMLANADGNHGDTPAPADNKGDTPTPQRPDLAHTHGETWSPAYNIGGGGIISNKSVEDPAGSGSISNEAHGNTGIIAQA
ncbi:hypothetical protein [Bacillus cereus group sp. BfR-BA-01380]|uniref:hypothetical protein n=1 Tax=Bacillus cereus group sp. BfR-BA-01380 TaxID=2920324 RepID=UPI001F589064|nr:hypothetical protein [Bacillus cereus group sp. BfR-BA-01380]